MIQAATSCSARPAVAATCTGTSPDPRTRPEAAITSARAPVCPTSMPSTAGSAPISRTGLLRSCFGPLAVHSGNGELLLVTLELDASLVNESVELGREVLLAGDQMARAFFSLMMVLSWL